ncbi:hypothetical protein C8Q72DRAFT_93281 [Fomitopsis betulina]|nr:hypothetical protein C8Q72DRAFT_93281 [Fomitopsis betulina]
MKRPLKNDVDGARHLLSLREQVSWSDPASMLSDGYEWVQLLYEPQTHECQSSLRATTSMSEVGQTYGAAYIGVCISAVLYGITNLQVFVYFKEYRHDTLLDKLVVCWLWILDSLHLAFCVYMLYWYLITSYGNKLELLVVHWSFKTEIIITAIVMVCVQALYTIRVWHLEETVYQISGWHRFRPISVIIVLAFLAAFAAASFLCYEVVRVNNLISVFRPSEIWRLAYYPLGTASFVDTLIATALCYLLSRCRTGFRRTDTVIMWLMFYTLNTGILTTTCTLISIILLAVFPGKLYFVTVEFIMVKLYINSYLAMLNARSSLLHAKNRVPEHAVGPMCIVCRSRSTGDARLRKDYFMPTSNSWITKTRSEVDSVDPGAQIDLAFPETRDKMDTVPPAV